MKHFETGATQELLFAATGCFTEGRIDGDDLVLGIEDGCGAVEPIISSNQELWQRALAASRASRRSPPPPLFPPFFGHRSTTIGTSNDTVVPLPCSLRISNEPPAPSTIR
jgi:hypothetical protein